MFRTPTAAGGSRMHLHLGVVHVFVVTGNLDTISVMHITDISPGNDAYNGRLRGDFAR